jgi:hypothetical protein
MTDPPSAGQLRPPATPKWVKALAILALVLIVGFVVLVVAGGHHGGPSMHFPSEHPATAAPSMHH